MESFFYTLLMIVEVIVAVMLIGIILVQRSKSGGGMGAMAGGSTEAIFGANAGNVLTKTTTWLIVTFFAVTIAINIMSSESNTSYVEKTTESKTEASTEVAPKATESTKTDETASE